MFTSLLIYYSHDINYSMRSFLQLIRRMVIALGTLSLVNMPIPIVSMATSATTGLVAQNMGGELAARAACSCAVMEAPWAVMATATAAPVAPRAIIHVLVTVMNILGNEPAAVSTLEAKGVDETAIFHL
jgi:hypothetical protein